LAATAFIDDRGKKMKKKLLALCLLACTGVANATPVVNGFDLSQFSFDVSEYKYSGSGLDGKATALGTSNGIAWSIAPTNLWSGATRTNGTFSFSALPVTTDNLHPSSDFTITFAQPISTLIVALSNDNTNDSINFGIDPSFVQGATFDKATHQITLNNARGGLAWFENVDSLTISNKNTNFFDGYNLAFHAVAVVPEPETYAMLLAGLGLMGAVARRRRQQQ
jgi:hypothetical protein